MGIISALSSLLFPKQCPICGSVLVHGEKLICTKCLLDFPWSDPDYQAFDEIAAQFPPELQPDKLLSLFHYDKGMDAKNIILAVKYRDRPDIAFELGKLLGEHIADRLEGDIIIPVPLHPKRLRQRGYNQSAEIANGLSFVTGIPTEEGVIERAVNTKSQTEKSAEERISSLKDAFRLTSPERVIGRHIILVDDVITTGGTIGACMESLAKGGATRLTLACIARTLL